MRRAALLVLVLAAAPLSAEVRPTPGVGDPRIQTVIYDPQQVVQLQVAIGYQLTLEFGADERVETVALGESGSWQVTPSKRGDHLFIKASAPGTATNMTVVTDVRSYTFLLSPAFGPTPDMAFTVRLLMPAQPAAPLVEAADAGRYKLSGDRGLRPSAIDDDGVHTYIEWAPERTLPGVFAIDPQGKETLVNGMMRDKRYVIDSVADHLIFRIDRHVAYARRVPKRRLP